jgi:hypothetical protein
MLVRFEVRFRRCFVLMSVVCSSLAIILIGCRTAPMANTVVDQDKNPDGRSSAILVERYRHAALNANIFYVLVLSSNEDLERATNDEEIEKRSALVATKASKVILRYENSSTLLVICNACGLEAVDIMQKRDHVADTKIVYQGFPQHTAYQ